jgi:hypothetical protein
MSPESLPLRIHLRRGCNAIEVDRAHVGAARSRRAGKGGRRRQIMKQIVYRCLIGAALVGGFAGQAVAADAKCSAVDIQIKNEYHDPVTGARVDIKVVDFQYWDAEDAKWRNEVTDNKRTNFGQTAVWNKNLESVGGETGVKIKVYFKYDQAGGPWSTDHTQTTNLFKCTDGTTVPITIN